MKYKQAFTITIDYVPSKSMYISYSENDQTIVRSYELKRCISKNKMKKLIKESIEKFKELDKE